MRRQRKNRVRPATFEAIRQHLAGIDEEIRLADGFEDALIGSAEGWFPADGGKGATRRTVALYDFEKCVEILMKRDGMTQQESIEYLEYNTLGAYVGGSTPVFAVIHRRPKLALPV